MDYFSLLNGHNVTAGVKSKSESKIDWYIGDTKIKDKENVTI